MRIGIDASRANVKIRTGTEWYSYFIIREIIKQDSKNEFILYVKEPLLDDMSDLTERATIRVLTWKPKFLWNLIRLSWELLLHSPDVLFVPAHTIPMICPTRTVTTCHDIGFERYPQLYATKMIGPQSRLFKRLFWIFAKIMTLGRYGNTELDYHRFSMRLAIRKAARIITPSDFTAQEINQAFDCPSNKITTIHHGLNQNYSKQYSAHELDGVLNKFGISRPYLLFLGRWEDKKNIGLLLTAFEEVHNSNKNIQLVLAGKPGWGFDKAWASISPDAKLMVKLCTGVQAEAPTLMAGATAFIFPSAYEGFGLPIIEAMASGTPVITTRCGSLPEIAGDSALYCDDKDPRDLAEQIRIILQNDSIRSDYIRRGLERAKDFTWETAGKKTLKVIREWGA